MASPVELDLEALLRPISEQQPGGPDLREDLSPESIFLKIKDARWTARAAERTGFADADSEAAADSAWRRILELAPRALASGAKDLEIAAFWTEALTRSRGFAGLRDGVLLLHGLVDGFWEQLYPRPDAEDGVGAVVAPLASLNGEGSDGPLPSRIALIPLTDPVDEHGGLSTWHCQQAREMSKLTDPAARAEREKNGAVTPEAFNAALAATSNETLTTTLADIEAALTEWEALSSALNTRCGADAPPASAVRDALAAALDTLRFATKDRLAQAGADGATADGSGAPERGGAGGQAGGVPGSIRSREDAFRALQAAARYFRETEPHSPIPYAIEQTVRWGHLSLPELLRELISDESARTSYFQRVGIRDDAPSP